MTKKEKRKKSFSSITMGLLIIGILFITYSDPLKKWCGVGFFALALILLFFNSLGTFFYAKGAKLLKGNNPPVIDALPYFKKAIKWGMDGKNEVLVATLLIQYDDIELGRKVLEEYISDQDVKISGSAKVALSMYYELKKDRAKAIELVEEAYSMGYRDRNLYINLCTYYLEDRKLEKFKKYAKEAREKNLATAATLDLEVVYYMMQNDWHRSGNILKTIFDATLPTFIDPYLHKAMILLHYGEWEKAVKALKEIEENCHYTNTAIYSKAQIETFIAYIEDKETRWGFLSTINSDPHSFLMGKVPQPEVGVPLPSFTPIPEFEKDVEKEEKEEEETIADDRDIDTSLNEEDEEWIRKHQ